MFSSFEVHVDGLGESIDVFGGSLLLLACSHRRSASTCHVDPHKFFIMNNTLVKGKPALKFPEEAARCKDELTIPVMSYIVIVWHGWLVTQALHARFTYVVSDAKTDTFRGWSL